MHYSKRKFFFLKNNMHNYLKLLIVELAAFLRIASTASLTTIAPLRAVIPFCLLRCKDEHMVQMENEWSMDFAFPLLPLMRSNMSEEWINGKIVDICEQNDVLEKCLKTCSASAEQEILLIGLEPWREICTSMKVMQSQFPCWKSNVDILTLNCYLERHKLRSSMQMLTQNFSRSIVNVMCNDLNTLGACSISEYSKYCGTITKQLMSRLFRISRESMMKMLKMKWKKLPAECLREWTTFEMDDYTPKKVYKYLGESKCDKKAYLFFMIALSIFVEICLIKLVF